MTSNNTTNNGSLANVNHFYAASLTGSGSISAVENIYTAASGANKAQFYGFLSSVNVVAGKDNHNFYALGNAPIILLVTPCTLAILNKVVF